MSLVTCRPCSFEFKMSKIEVKGRIRSTYLLPSVGALGAYKSKKNNEIESLLSEHRLLISSGTQGVVGLRSRAKVNVTRLYKTPVRVN